MLQLYQTKVESCGVAAAHEAGGCHVPARSDYRFCMKTLESDNEFSDQGAGT